MIVVLGDIHGKWNRVNPIINREAETTALCVGDLGNYKFNPQNRQRLIFVHGNHEAFSYIQELHNSVENPKRLCPLFAGDVYEAEGLRIAGFPGVYSEHFFGQTSRPLKFYGREDIEAVASLRDINVLLLHEGPSGIELKKEGKDVGKDHIRHLIERLQPDIAFFGHHNTYIEAAIGRTIVVGLESPHRSYSLLDPSNMALKRQVARLKDGRYTYEWEP